MGWNLIPNETQATALETAQYRLAKHYLNKLRRADAAIRHGQASVTYGVTLFDQEWEQIRHWQGWVAQRSGDDVAAARLCKEFPLAGAEVLATRSSPRDHIGWLECAIEAANQFEDDEAKYTLYHEMALLNYRIGLLDKVGEYVERLLTLGEATGNPLSTERAFALFGVLAADRGLYDEAEQHYDRALKLAEELRLESELVRALNGLGSVAFYRGDYPTSYRHLTRQLELMEASGRKMGICHALISMGRVPIGMQAHERADEVLQRAVGMCRTNGYLRLLGVGLINLGLLASQQQQLDAALGYLEEGVQIVRSTNTQRQIIRGLTLLGDTEMRLDAALTHLQESLQLGQEAGLPRHLCDVQQVLANTYLALSDLEAAKSALREAVMLARNLGSQPQQIAAIGSGIAYFARQGANEQAASWVGAIWDDAAADHALLAPVCAELEAKLSSKEYQQAVAQGKGRALEDVAAGILYLLA